MNLAFPRFLVATLLVFLAAACTGGVDGSPDDQDDGDGDSHVTHDDDGDDDGDTGGDDTSDSLPSDGDGAGPTEPCPAPALGAKQIVVYGEGEGSGWTSGGFSSSPSTETSNVCSGSKALKYISHHFDGIYFVHGSNLAANHLSVRVFVSEDTNFTIAAVPNGGDGHCYRLPFPTSCGENSPVDCGNGSNQHAAPCILSWTAGWNIVEMDIPASTGVVKSIFFERQNQGAETVTLIVDDLRLTQP